MPEQHRFSAENRWPARLTPLVAELFRLAGRMADRETFLASALPAVVEATGADAAIVARGVAGSWEMSGQSGSRQSLPTELLAEALDRGQPHVAGLWAGAPLGDGSGLAEALAAHFDSPAAARQAMELVGQLASVLAEALRSVDERHRDLRRLKRLEAILEIAGHWNRSTQLEPLLAAMAEAATRLFGADRASIFLWDRASRTLVGRPALGAPGGELRIPDHRGVVGQVIQTGEPRRADAATTGREIDHEVDQKLGYRTRSLLCVPLRGRSGELFGAFELLNKGSGVFSADDEEGLVELAAHAATALENVQDREHLLLTSRQLSEQSAGKVQLIGQSKAIDALRSVVRRIADTELAVLILGENGTGKEVIAQSVHYLSRRRAKPFIAVNCAAIPDTLAESELFGHEKGAFTDAHEPRLGKFELAADGTLFLDEIGDLSLAGQAKLLRVLEEKVIVRVGGSRPIHTDARVLAATNQDLAEMVRQKRFREDLYFRLNVVTLDIPPLRERPEDIMLLADYFLQDFCRKARRAVPKFSAAARSRLESHSWPGNVRELRNLMERLAYLSAEDRVEVDDVAFILSPRAAARPEIDVNRPLAEATSDFQAEYIRRAIDRSRGNMSQAAALLGLHRSNLYRKMRQLGMPVPG